PRTLAPIPMTSYCPPLLSSRVLSIFLAPSHSVLLIASFVRTTSGPRPEVARYYILSCRRLPHHANSHHLSTSPRIPPHPPGVRSSLRIKITSVWIPSTIRPNFIPLPWCLPYAL